MTRESAFAILRPAARLRAERAAALALIRLRAEEQIGRRGAGFSQAIEKLVGRHQKLRKDVALTTCCAATCAGAVERGVALLEIRFADRR